MSFGSDNRSGASAAVLGALVQEFSQNGGSYGADEATLRAENKLREVETSDRKSAKTRLEIDRKSIHE